MKKMRSGKKVRFQEFFDGHDFELPDVIDPAWPKMFPIVIREALLHSPHDVLVAIQNLKKCQPDTNEVIAAGEPTDEADESERAEALYEPEEEQPSNNSQNPITRDTELVGWL